MGMTMPGMAMIELIVSHASAAVVRGTGSDHRKSYWSLAFALPLAFLVSGAVGVALERGVLAP